MGEYAQMELDNADWDDPFIGIEYDNYYDTMDAVKVSPELCKEVMERYNILFVSATKHTFLYKCLLWYDKHKFLSRKQIGKIIELKEAVIHKQG